MAAFPLKTPRTAGTKALVNRLGQLPIALFLTTWEGASHR